MNIVGISEQTNTKGVDWRITPAFVEEPTSTVQVLEVGLVLVAAEEIHVTNLKVGPEVAGRVTIGNLGVFRTNSVFRNPVQHIVLAQVGGVCGQELLGLGPESADGLRGVVKVDGETVGLVAILHVSEHVVVNIAEELDIGLNAPVVTVVLEGLVLVKHSAVPAAHLVVGDLRRVLDVLFLQNLGGVLEELHADPARDGPMFLGNQFYATPSKLGIISGRKRGGNEKTIW